MLSRVRDVARGTLSTLCRTVQEGQVFQGFRMTFRTNRADAVRPQKPLRFATVGIMTRKTLSVTYRAMNKLPLELFLFVAFGAELGAVARQLELVCFIGFGFMTCFARAGFNRRMHDVAFS